MGCTCVSQHTYRNRSNGIAVPGEPSANPMEASGRVVTTYALAHGHRATHGAWDYSDEHPLLDARGFELPRSRADISQLTDEEDPVSYTHLRAHEP